MDEVPIVKARGLEKIYDTGALQVRALAGVDLVIQAGEMVAVMGPSGCGKTTLLNCLSGLDRFEHGDVAIEGVSLAHMSDTQRTTYRAQRADRGGLDARHRHHLVVLGNRGHHGPNHPVQHLEGPG